ncbi:MAG: hypothetical protein ABSE48_14470 [Verrucomicrobiota bacterium]|jgi:hypothetical protein
MDDLGYTTIINLARPPARRRGSALVRHIAMKFAIRVILLSVAAFVIFCVCSVVSLFIPRHGEAAHVSDLRSAFSKAGPEIEAIFTNSLIQKFPFDGTIEWRLTLFKDPYLSLDGRVDTNALRTFVSAHSGTQFYWSGTDDTNQNWFADEWPTKKKYPSVTWTSITFGTPHTNQFGAVIDGTLDIVSNRVHFFIH